MTRDVVGCFQGHQACPALALQGSATREVSHYALCSAFPPSCLPKLGRLPTSGRAREMPKEILHSAALGSVPWVDCRCRPGRSTQLPAPWLVRTGHSSPTDHDHRRLNLNPPCFTAHQPSRCAAAQLLLHHLHNTGPHARGSYVRLYHAPQQRAHGPICVHASAGRCGVRPLFFSVGLHLHLHSGRCPQH